MNVHHIELFYHVARSGGIVAACRSMPYGIQQPAVSAQVARLEEELGVRLFERRPFRLTSAGQVLYDFAKPFFGRLQETEDYLRGRMGKTVRIAGLTEVMRGHVPSILAQMRRTSPDLKLTLQEIDQRGAERLIGEGAADIAITVLETKLPPGFRSHVLARLPLALILRKGDDLDRFPRAAAVLQAGAAGRVPLISLPPHEMLPRLFQKELAKRGLVWRTSMETSSQDLVSIYVRNGLGAGLAVATPDLLRDEAIRLFPLKGFPSLPIGAFWRGHIEGSTREFFDALEERSRQVLAG